MDKLYDVAEDAGYVDNFIPAPTFRTEFPAMRLDYIFTMNGLKTSKYEKIKKVVSDHFPIYATVVLDK